MDVFISGHRVCYNLSILTLENVGMTFNGHLRSSTVVPVERSYIHDYNNRVSTLHHVHVGLRDSDTNSSHHST